LVTSVCVTPSLYSCATSEGTQLVSFTKLRAFDASFDLWHPYSYERPRQC
jgi:hypothetical protein